MKMYFFMPDALHRARHSGANNKRRHAQRRGPLLGVGAQRRRQRLRLRHAARRGG